ncbi:MAG: Asp-tRNA(Asn)/Glu-tRNA(Gln) amidotransferase subunit GatB [Planctomycetota bacterium]
MSVRAVIGLEVHIELDTKSKLFCSCSTAFGAEPNTQVCPVCLGMPGVLPVMNRRAFELALRVAAALRCRIAPFTKWDRKGYYYPDLPKNYQISQYDLPLSSDGCLEVRLPDGSKKEIRIRRAHLEEDAGKNIHENPGYTAVDLNRTGIPLLEVVTEPDMNTVEEVMAFARSLHALVRWLGASAANMEMGQMRFEPNVNLHVDELGRSAKTPIVEVKNLNSFRSLERASSFEIDRQYSEWRASPDDYTLEKLGKTNRGYDETTGETLFQRSKEEAHDYRYFPEPDLVPVTVSPEFLARIERDLPELPADRSDRFVRDYSLPEYDASVLTSDRALSDYFEAVVKSGADPKAASNWVMGDLLRELKERKIDVSQFPLGPEKLAGLIKLVTAGTISTKIARETVFPEMLSSSSDARQIVEKRGLTQISDAGELEAMVDAAIAANPKAVSDFVAGKKTALSFLVGQIMRQTKGKANPAALSEMIAKKLTSK